MLTELWKSHDLSREVQKITQIREGILVRAIVDGDIEVNEGADTIQYTQQIEDLRKEFKRDKLKKVLI